MEPLRLYRVVKTNPPTLRDFIPLQQHYGEHGDDPPERARLWSGLSVFATLAQARRQARRFPALGTFVAEVQIPDSVDVHLERTLRTPGHFTLWGEAELLLNWISRVETVAEEL